MLGVAEVVTITGDAPPIEPTRTEVSQTIDTAQISSLPVSGRLFTDFALLTPGVATGRTSLGTTVTEFEVTQISFAGMRSFSNLITVDGADFINANTGVQRATPPQESVKEFRVVNNGFGAGMLIKEFRPDLVVLDIMLPDINGKEVCHLVRSDKTMDDVRIICISGMVEEDKIEDLKAAGANDFLHKPFEVEKLVERMCQLLDIEAITAM